MNSQIEDIYILTPMQQGLLYECILAEFSDLYIQKICFDLHGEFNFEYFASAFEQLIDRHSIFRTSFKWNGLSEPHQIVHRECKLPIEYLDFSNLTDEKQKQQTQLLEKRVNEFKFDLNRAPLIHLKLVRYGKDYFRCHFIYHHMIMDGWSLSNIITELKAIYESQLNGHKAFLVSPLPYKKYVEWIKRHNLEQSQLEWNHKYADVEVASLVPFSKTHSQHTSYEKFSKINVEIPASIIKSFKQNSSSSQITLSSVLHAAWALTLSRLSRSEEVIIGTTVSGRPQDLEDAEHMIGLFINTLPVRAKLTAAKTVSELVLEVQNELIYAQERPFSRLSRIRGAKNISQLFDSLVVYENFPIDESQLLSIGPTKISFKSLLEKTGYPWVLVAVPKANKYMDKSEGFGIELNCIFQSDRIEKAVAQEVLLSVRHVFTMMLENFSTRIQDINLIRMQEWDLKFRNWNRPSSEFCFDGGILKSIESWMEETPDAIALQSEDQSITYKKLQNWMLNISHELHLNGVKKGDRVAIRIGQSPEMIAAILGVLNAGAVYLPIDPETPESRVRYYLENAQVKMLLEVDCIKAWKEKSNLDLVIKEVEFSPSDPAYILYTSGSSGQPKGVEVHHGGLENYVRWSQREFGSDRGNGSILLSSISFDMSIAPIFASICSGKTIWLLKEFKNISDVLKLLSSLKNASKELGFLMCAPAYMSLLVDECVANQIVPRVLNWVLGGESLTANLCHKLWNLTPSASIINAYGPTEISVACTAHKVSPDINKDGLVPIGHPITGSQIYIVDSAGHLLPQNLTGEIWIGGVGVANGYVGDLELTAKSFLKNPFLKNGQTWLYRSGDLGRINSKGELEYSGRIDNQIKIRGQRIELDEIEIALARSPQIQDVRVGVKNTNDGSQKIIAYVVPKNSFFDEEIEKTSLRQVLPEIMIPNFWHIIESIPKTLTGKIDRRALEQINIEFVTNEAKAKSKDVMAEPANENEKILSEIWCRVLKLQFIDVRKNFFELGGDSIQALQIISQARKFGFQISLKSFYESQTIQKLANLNITEPQYYKSTEVKSSFLTPIQTWFLRQNFPISDHWNQSVSLIVKKNLDPKLLEKAIRAVVQNHQVLRTAYVKDPKYQDKFQSEVLVLPDSKFVWSAYPQEFENRVKAAQTSLSLSKGELLRIVLEKPNGDQFSDQRLFISIHHMAMDGLSWKILTEDVFTYYDQLEKQKELPEFSTLSPTITDWGRSLMLLANENKLESAWDFWKSELNKKSFVSNSFGLEASVAMSHKVLSATATRNLLQMISSGYHGMRVQELLLWALYCSLEKWDSSLSEIINIENHGRDATDYNINIDTSQVMGWFTSLYPIINKSGMKLEDFTHRFKEFSKNGLAFGILREWGTGEQCKLLREVRSTVAFNHFGSLDFSSKNELNVEISQNQNLYNRNPSSPRIHRIEFITSIIKDELHIEIEWSRECDKAERIEELLKLYLNEINLIIASSIPKNTEPIIDTKPDKNLRFPLTPSQRGLFYHHLIDPNDEAYSIIIQAKLEGALNISNLKRAWETVILKYEILRSRIVLGDGKSPFWEVQNNFELPWEEFENKNSTSYDFESGSLFRVNLIQIGHNKYIMKFKFHHVLLDGWSAVQLLNEVMACYQEPNLQFDFNLALKFSDYANWVHDRVGNNEFISAWKNELKGIEHQFNLPYDSETNQGYGLISKNINTTDTNLLIQLARKEKISLSTLVQAAWALTLSRRAMTSEVLFGTTTSGRSAPLDGLDSMIGMCINSLPLRVQIDENKTISLFLKQIHEKMQFLQENDGISLSEIQNLTNIPHGFDLFNILTVVENFPLSSENVHSFAGITVNEIEVNEKTHYQLTLEISIGSEIRLQISHNKEFYSEKYCRLLLEQLSLTLGEFTRGSEQILKSLDLIAVDEKKLLIKEWNSNSQAFPVNRSYEELFEEQVFLSPQSIAVTCGTRKLTYTELHLWSEALADLLRSHGIKNEKIVALMAKRDIEYLVAILAVFKAGAAYVPLDPMQPWLRNMEILKQSNASILIGQNSSQNDSLISIENGVLDWDFVLKETSKVLQTHSIITKSRSKPGSTGKSLRYIMFTSGSTGKPKGVMIEQEGMINHLFTKIKDLEITASDCLAQNASETFDISVWQFLSPLLVGAQVRIIPSDRARDTEALIDDIRLNDVTLVETVPSMMRAILDFWDTKSNNNIGKLRCLVVNAEPLPPELCRRWFEMHPLIPLVNAYGTTEVSDDVCHYWIRNNKELEKHIGFTIPVGPILPNAKIYILDTKLQTVPFGAIGEVYVGGICVGRGYYKDPVQTARVYLPDPFCSDVGARMYKTGDQGKFLANGSLDILGRTDFQVKIRGSRVEVGAIEAILKEIPGVSQAVVIATKNQDTMVLIAYVVPFALTKNIDTKDLFDFLERNLPEYMIPSEIAILSSIPTNANGKIDRAALLNLRKEASSRVIKQTENNHISDMEIKLAGIWRDILGKSNILREDNFFRLGGHSLLAVKLLNTLRELYPLNKKGGSLNLKMIFENPVLKDMAIAIEQESAHKEKSVTISNQKLEEKIGPLSLQQRRLWFIEKLRPSSTAYNVVSAVRIRGALNVPSLSKAFDLLVERHEVLRSEVFVNEDGEPKVRILKMTHGLLQQFTKKINPNNEESANRIIDRVYKEECEFVFNLENGPLIRAKLIELGHQDFVLFLNLHHFITDGWSMEVLIRDLAMFYYGKESLPNLKFQYLDYSKMQSSILNNERMDELLSFWRSHLGPNPQASELPTYITKENNITKPSDEGGSYQFQISKELLLKSRALADSAGVTSFMLFFAAFNTIVARWTQRNDVILGIPSANRDDSGIEDLIGFFVNTLAVKTEIQVEQSFFHNLDYIKKTLLDIYANQEIPFEKLISELSISGDLRTGRTPLVNILFNYLAPLSNTHASENLFSGLNTEIIQQPLVFAKFPLTVYVVESELKVNIDFVYQKSIHSLQQMEELGGQFIQFLDSVTTDPDKPVGKIYCPGPWSQKLLPNPSEHLSLVDHAPLFYSVLSNAEKNPERIAIEGNVSLSYQMLDKLSEKLARLMVRQIHNEIKRKPRTHQFVAIVGRKSVATALAAFTVHRSGGAILFLDSKYPLERLKKMASIADPVACLAIDSDGFSMAQKLFNDSEIKIVTIGQNESTDLEKEIQEICKEQLMIPILPKVESHSAAYLFFTSGTTGVPKGIVGVHRGLSHFVNWQYGNFDFADEFRVGHITNLGFDVLMRELYLPWIGGGTLVIPIQGIEDHPSNFMDWLENKRISVLHMVPSIASVLLESKVKHIDNLSKTFFAGEPLNDVVVEKWKERFSFCEVINLYGPTETTLAKFFDVVSDPPHFGVQPVGRPIPGAQGLIVRGDQELCAIGEVGEIWIRTPYRTLGYIDERDSIEKFVLNPFIPKAELIDFIYRTGDLGRFLPDGRIEHLGRKDDEVKIRGVRINPASVAAIIQKQNGIAQVFVTSEIKSSGKILVAYIVTDEKNKISTHNLRNNLSAELPEPFIPSYFYEISEMPLLANGKVDRTALVQMKTNKTLESTDSPKIITEPRDRIELIVLKVFREVLDQSDLNIQANFFENGGHSLLVLSFLARIEKELGLKLEIIQLYESPTPQSFANIIRTQQLNTKNLNYNRSLITLNSIKKSNNSFSKTPFFCVHPVGGTTTVFSNWAKYWPKDRPFFVFQARGVEFDDEPMQTVEEMAISYLQELKNQVPNGPYIIGGYSMGSVVAYEMVRLLRIAGDKVVGPVIVDLDVSEKNPQQFNYDELQELQGLMKINGLNGDKITEVGQAHQLFQERGLIPENTDKNLFQRLLKVRTANLKARSQYLFPYLPVDLNAPAVIIRSEESQMKSHSDSSLGWRNLISGPLLTHTVSGNHESMMDVGAKEFANWFNQKLSDLRL